MGKILLFYKYVSIAYPKQIWKEQRDLCDALGLKGRIFLATEGINGTLGGSVEAVEKYKKAMDGHSLFANIDFKEGPGGPDDFPRMQITIKKEIVALELDKKKYNTTIAGQHLTPKETHQLLDKKPDDLVIIDCRNNYEWKIGAFEGAIKPDVNSFREFPEWVDQNKEALKDKQVLIYCTGGIRCERASSYLKQETGAKKVFQIQGGIHRYVEQYPEGFFRGKNYVFDGRVGVRINDDILGTCKLCDKPSDEYTNCKNAECNDHFIYCQNCIESYDNCCSKECMQLLKMGRVKERPPFCKSKQV